MNYNEKLINLNNGVKLVFMKTSGHFTARIRVQFSVGAEDENKPYGISHLIEHGVFKGTSKYSQEELSSEFNKISAEPNANTSAEFTTYKAVFPKSKIERVCELLSDMLFDSQFDPVGLEKEKKIIFEEIYMHDDQPEDLAFQNLTSAMFDGSGLMNKLAGEIELLNNVKREDILKYMQSHYLPENCFIAVMGDYDEKYVISLIEKYFNSRFLTRAGENGLQKKIFTPKVTNKPVTIFEEKDLNQTNVIMGYYTTGYTNLDRMKLSLINIVLGGSMSSRLFVKARNERSLCYNIYSALVDYCNNGMLIVDFSATNKNSEQAINLVKEEVQQIAKDGITDAEFEEAKNILVNGYLMKQDLPYVNLDYLAYTGELFDREKMKEFLMSLTKKDCEETFKSFLLGAEPFISVVGGKK